MRALNNYSCEGQMSIFDLLSQDSWSGKTSPEPSVQTKEKTSDVFLKKFAELRIKPPMYLFLGGEVVNKRLHHGRLVERCLAFT